MLLSSFKLFLKCHLLGSPMRWMLPMDHAHGYKEAIVASKKPEEAKALLVQNFSSWVRVGALSCGLFVALLACVQTSNVQNSLPSQLLTQLCTLGAFVSFTGPVVLGTVLYINCAATAAVHAAIFLAMARPTMLLYESQAAAMCYLGALAFPIFGLVRHVPASQLPEPWPVLESLEFNLAIIGFQLVLLVCIVWSINVTSTVNMYGGLFSSKPLDVDHAEFHHLKVSPDDDVMSVKEAVRRLVERSSDVESLQDLLESLENPGGENVDYKILQGSKVAALSV